MRRLLVGLSGSAVFVAGTLLGYEALAPTSTAGQKRSRPFQRGSSLEFDQTRSKASFSRRSETYDGSIDRDELLMGIKILRWYIIRKYVAGDDVLEVSAGTGRNFHYYNNANLTLSDANRDMLIEASSKVRDTKARRTQTPNTILCLADSEDLVDESKESNRMWMAGSAASMEEERSLRTPRKFPPESFDTVVDTFGLCSLADPCKALDQMVRVVRPGGRIILLEHGKGTWRIVNDILDAQEVNHFERWGCDFNRDLDKAITDLIAKQKLLVVTRWRMHFGTTICAVLQKPFHDRVSTPAGESR